VVLLGTIIYVDGSFLDVGKSTVHYWIDRFKDVLDSERKGGVKKLAIVRIAVDMRG